MKNSIPAFNEYILLENLTSLQKVVVKPIIEDILYLYEVTSNYMDFKEIVKSEINNKYNEDSWELVEQSIKPLYDSLELNESEILADWMKPTSDLSVAANQNFKSFKTGKQNYTDFPFGTIVKCTNEDFESFGWEGKIKSLEGLYFRIETENGVTFECKPEDLIKI